MTTPAPGQATERQRVLLRIHFHPTDPATRYTDLLAVLDTVTARVEPHPGTWSADADLTGALRYWQRTPADLITLIRLRLLALHATHSTAGAGPTRTVAEVAAATAPPHTARTVSTGEVEEFLRHQPVAVLPGIGPARVRALTRYGIHTAGDITATPLPTLHRILGTAPARLAHDRARGHDPRTVTPTPVPQSATAEHHFDHDELDPHRQRAALLGLTHHLGHQLRSREQAAGALTLTVRYADRTTTARHRTLPEATAHTPALTATAYALHEALGLQRARVRALTLRATGLRPAAETARQLLLDPTDDRARHLEAAADRARARYGPAAVRAATLAS